MNRDENLKRDKDFYLGLLLWGGYAAYMLALLSICKLIETYFQQL